MDNFNPEDSDVYKTRKGVSNLAGFMGSKNHMYIGIDKAFDTNGTHSLGKRLYMSLDTMVAAWR